MFSVVCLMLQTMTKGKTTLADVLCPKSHDKLVGKQMMNLSFLNKSWLTKFLCAAGRIHTSSHPRGGCNYQLVMDLGKFNKTQKD